jgi:Domain of unknown function (DUF1918)
MRASVGDRINIVSHRGHEPSRDCEVLEVQGAEGGPPYVVRWSDTGHTAMFFPGTDASVQHFVHENA